MAIKVKYSDESISDLKEVFDFIKKGSLKYANIEIKSIRTFIAKLRKDKYLGKPFDRFEKETLRVIIYKSYLIIYEISSDDLIDILTIHHHSRSFSRNTAIETDE